MILLSAQNIAKTYMERKVLDDVSFFLNEGDKVGIIAQWYRKVYTFANPCRSRRAGQR